MKNKLSGLLIFIVGAGIGSGITYYLIDKNYKEEISELERQIRDIYDSLDNEINEEIEEPEPTKEDSIENKSSLKMEMLSKKKEITDYANIIKEEKYDKKEEEESMMIDGEITLIDDVDNFGEDPFELVYATLYADGYLVDNFDHIIDIEMIGGEETLEHFGEGEDPNLLRVRNELYEIDYEIDKDDRTYAEVSGKSPSELPDLD